MDQVVKAYQEAGCKGVTHAKLYYKLSQMKKSSSPIGMSLCSAWNLREWYLNCLEMQHLIPHLILLMALINLITSLQLLRVILPQRHMLILMAETMVYQSLKFCYWYSREKIYKHHALPYLWLKGSKNSDDYFKYVQHSGQRPVTHHTTPYCSIGWLYTYPTNWNMWDQWCSPNLVDRTQTIWRVVWLKRVRTYCEWRG